MIPKPGLEISRSLLGAGPVTPSRAPDQPDHPIRVHELSFVFAQKRRSDPWSGRDAKISTIREQATVWSAAAAAAALLYATGVAETSERNVEKRNAGVLAGWCGGVPRRHSVATAKLLIGPLSRPTTGGGETPPDQPAGRQRSACGILNIAANPDRDSEVPDDNGCPSCHPSRGQWHTKAVAAATALQTSDGSLPPMCLVAAKPALWRHSDCATLQLAPVRQPGPTHDETF